MYLTSLIMNMAQKENTKIAQRVYDYLDRDLVSVVVVDDKNKIYYFEYRSRDDMPKYVRGYIQRKLSKLGYQYLYDKFPGRPFFTLCV